MDSTETDVRIYSNCDNHRVSDDAWINTISGHFPDISPHILILLLKAFYPSEIPLRMLWIVFAIFFQFLALGRTSFLFSLLCRCIAWYTLSFVPFARDLVKNFCMNTCCKCDLFQVQLIVSQSQTKNRMTVGKTLIILCNWCHSELLKTFGYHRSREFLLTHTDSPTAEIKPPRH